MSKEYIAPNTNTDEWEAIPFEVNGVNFISKVNKESNLGKRILSVPANIFAQMNQGAILESLGNPALMTRYEILAELERINHGGTQAILELA